MLQFKYISATYIMTGKKKKRKALHQKTKTLPKWRISGSSQLIKEVIFQILPGTSTFKLID